MKVIDNYKFEVKHYPVSYTLQELLDMNDEKLENHYGIKFYGKRKRMRVVDLEETIVLDPISHTHLPVDWLDEITDAQRMMPVTHVIIEEECILYVV